ncbi:hypothetical protein Tco_1053856 [Tanacetum coccineum]|uniref:Uncharacterized protein n=1 Tax=Tanacetum coccineum TaxID=301880 RepID=A0ABQ5GW49_9ASTR
MISTGSSKWRLSSKVNSSLRHELMVRTGKISIRLTLWNSMVTTLLKLQDGWGEVQAWTVFSVVLDHIRRDLSVELLHNFGTCSHVAKAMGVCLMVMVSVSREAVMSMSGFDGTEIIRVLAGTTLRLQPWRIINSHGDGGGRWRFGLCLLGGERRRKEEKAEALLIYRATEKQFVSKYLWSAAAAARSAWERLFSRYHRILLISTVVTNSHYFCCYITVRDGDSNDGMTVVVNRTSFKIFSFNGKKCIAEDAGCRWKSYSKQINC